MSQRILALIPYKVFPAMMGGQKGIALFYKDLSQICALNVLTIKNNLSNESYPIFNLISNQPFRYINPMVFFEMNRLRKQTTSDFLLFEHPYYAWMIYVFSKWTSAKVIVHSHNIESERFKSIGKWWWKILWHYEKWAYQSANYVWFKTNEDRNHAIQEFRLNPMNCTTIPYGIENDRLPAQIEIENARTVIKNLYQIAESETILLFNGTLNYKPNLDALMRILDKINPFLVQEKIPYKIIICGKNLPDELNQLKEYQSKNIIYAGFVDDIDLYFKACDIFLNPLMDGGGIKTKLVEALGFGKPCVSSINGAIGVAISCTGKRLVIIPDNDWKAYVEAIKNFIEIEIRNNNKDFYNQFSWNNIAQKAINSLTV